jgi:hypothetical protein
MLKWSLELSEFDIQYEGRKALKAQALADFVVEMTAHEQAPKRATDGLCTSTEPQVRRGAVPASSSKTKKAPLSSIR